jgi:hypothetical protein
MNFGLDSFVLSPPLSQFVSVLLLISMDAIGILFVKLIGIELSVNNWLRWQAPVIGASVISVLLFPLALGGVAVIDNFKLIALSLVIISIVHLVNNLRKWNWGIKQDISLLKFIFWCLLLGYFFLALLPITNADSLDYHVGVALHILNTGGMPVLPEWFHSRLSGSGEVLNALGFSIGAEQFGSLLQFSGLFAIAGILLHFRDNTNLNHNDWGYYIAIAGLSSPVLIFLVSSVKPQMLPIALTTCALALFVFTFISKAHFNATFTKRVYLLISILVMVASQMKFSYMLGGGVVGLITLWEMKKINNFSYAVLTGFFSFSVIMLPTMLWKIYNYDAGYLESIIYPFPLGLPGAASFLAALREYADSTIMFPISLIVPNSVGNFTTIIGMGVLLLFLLNPKENKQTAYVFGISLFVFVIAFLYGPPTSRSYLESYFWILMILQPKQSHIIHKYFSILIRKGILIQCIFVVIVFIYSILTMGVGLLSTSRRSRVMTKHANGYEAMKWVNIVAPKDAVLLTSHRAMGIFQRKTISLDWLKYVENDSDINYYMQILKQKNITHILIQVQQGSDYKQSLIYRLFESCVVDIIGPGKAHIATRNPFNQGVPYKLWMVEIDLKKQMCHS